MDNKELKKQLILQANRMSLFSKNPCEEYNILAQLYTENNLTPAKHHDFKTKKDFTGVNLYILEEQFILKNYSSTAWTTFKRFSDSQKQIKKGEHGTMIKVPFLKKSEKDEQEEPTFFKKYIVFNENQTEQQGAKL